MRIGTANSYDSTLDNLTTRQSEMAALQDRVSSGKAVTKASDDPISAALIERSLTRIGQLQAEQRALGVQRNAITTAEATLGEGVDTLQRFRELMVQAGGVSLNASDRNTIAQELSGLRDKLFSLANAKDSNGTYLFSGLENTTQQGVGAPPFSSTGSGASTQYSFNGLPGQNVPTQQSVPYTMDGNAIFMQVDKGNGVYGIALGANSGQISTDAGTYSGATPMTDSYSITFSGTGAGMTYDVVNTTTSTTVLSAQPFSSGKTISFDGLSLSVTGAPKAGDSLTLSPYSGSGPSSAQTNLFALLDNAINGISGAYSSSPTLAQTVQDSLRQIDAGMEKLISAQGQAGEWLNRADSIASSQDVQSLQLESDRAAAQDIDLVRSISEFQNQQIGYEAALKSYAQVQKLSLFNYIG